MGRATITKQEGNDILKSATTGKTTTLSGNGVFAKAFQATKDENGNITRTILIGMSRSDARKTFNFMTDNTDAEWGYMQSLSFSDITTGFMGLTRMPQIDFTVGSSHSSDREAAVAVMIENLSKGTLIRYDHSHPFGHNLKNGYLPSTPTNTANRDGNNDVDFWKETLIKHPNASFGIRYNGKTYHYYKNGLELGY
jgi:hypothetical protein